MNKQDVFNYYRNILNWNNHFCRRSKGRHPFQPQYRGIFRLLGITRWAPFQKMGPSNQKTLSDTFSARHINQKKGSTT